MKVREGSRRFSDSKKRLAPGGSLMKIKSAPSSSMLKIKSASTEVWQKNNLASKGLTQLMSYHGAVGLERITTLASGACLSELNCLVRLS